MDKLKFVLLFTRNLYFCKCPCVANKVSFMNHYTPCPVKLFEKGIVTTKETGQEDHDVRE